MTKLGKWATPAGSLLLMSMLLLQGCGDMPTAPSSERGGLSTSSAAAASQGKSLINKLKKEAKTTTKTVGPLGDTIEVSLNSNGRKTGLIIPLGALNGQAQITMTVTELRHVSGRVAEYEFTPNGLQFRFGTTLYLDLNRPIGTTAVLSWYNPASKQWEDQGSAPVVNGRVSFPLITHFSKYGISCRGNGS